LAYYLTDGTSANLQETLLRIVIAKLFDWLCGRVSYNEWFAGQFEDITAAWL